MNYDDAPSGSPPPKTDRVFYLTRVIAEGRYRRTVTAMSLSERWGISYRTIENDACEAARTFKMNAEEREAYKLQQQAYCEALREEARQTTNAITGMPDFNAVAKFTELAAKFAGVDLSEGEAPAREPLRVTIVDAGSEDTPGEAAESGASGDNATPDR